ncbi:uncharacterized protein PHACADRAFT_26207 [Phanerochaete carnosa HHB-10118-sp]|uniref:Uncharacterized protein n=1 Tax=Phanerochaete carnosa (strain HHB-10118-sp) TaxID=650164 RepID=K5W119_PHACS|nr:uncharacterized protein PHACADRAFT_26207 [Phanerochaete carnosa HHB-10118-sp]EKM57543.1 hypothetical protein PHACADRAFT_26207 [Phanerochaete carnosa HHB-10118-sp]
MYTLPPQKRRRSATSVLAGDFDTRPQRDVLTSLLNGVPVYKAVEKAEEEEDRRARKKERRERDKDKKRVRLPTKPADKQPLPVPSTSTSASVPLAAPAPPKRPPHAPPRAPSASTSMSSFWQARPTINIATMQRSRSVTPPPMPSSPPTTPGPSISSSTSATSSKRPHTPDDGEDVSHRGRSVGTGSPPPPPAPKLRKKRIAARKGWKGWVEGSPPPSQKLINLDVVDVIPGERRTRSGKSFDAIGIGKDSWV